MRSAAPLARLLLAVGDARRDGVLCLEQRGRLAQLTLREGQLCAIDGVDLAPLGDVLRELHVLDDAHQLRACEGVPIGLRLIAAGATSWSGVQRALCEQRVRAVATLLRFPVTRAWRVQRRMPVRGGVVGLDLATAVWPAMLALAARMPDQARADLAHAGEALALTPAGTRRLKHDVGPALAQGSRELSLRAVLCALGFVAPRAVREDAYALLLRKRRQVARNASPRALLDLPFGADASGAQRALRKLAVKLHPDRFQADDARLHRVSHEVMGALTRAASMLSA